MPLVRAIPQVRQRQPSIGQGGCCAGAASGSCEIAVGVTLSNPPDGDRPLDGRPTDLRCDGRPQSKFPFCSRNVGVPLRDATNGRTTRTARDPDYTSAAGSYQGCDGNCKLIGYPAGCAG